MSEIYLRRKFLALRPADQEAEEIVRAIPEQEWIKATIRRPRNVKHHRKFFALVNVVFEHQSIFKTKDHLVAAIKLAVGHAELMTMRDGRVVFVPKSISFAKMPQDEFEKFYDAVCDWLVKDVLPGVRSEDLKREVMEFMADEEFSHA